MNWSRVADAIRESDPDAVAPLFDLRQIHEKAHTLTNLKANSFPAPWSSVLPKLVQAANQPDEKVAIEYYSGAVREIAQAALEPSFYTAIVRTICRSIFEFAKLDRCYRAVAEIYRRLMARRGPQVLDSPFLAVVNGLVSLYLLRNDYQNAHKTLKNVKSQTQNLSHDVYPVSEIASFLYLSGKVKLVFGKYRTAKQRLENALKLVPSRYSKDRRLILSLLVPVNVSLGVLPSDELVEKYDLHFFDPLVAAVRQGSLDVYERFLSENQSALIQMGIWEVVVATRKVVERAILQMIYVAKGADRIEVSAVCEVFSKFRTCTREEVELMICNLFDVAYVKANVVHNEGLVIFPPKVQMAFPPI